MKILSYSLSLLGALFLASCSEDIVEETPRDPIEVVQEDLDSLDHDYLTGAEQLDSRHQEAFRKMFGGLYAQDFKSYLSERTKHFVAANDSTASISPERSKYPGWQTPRKRRLPEEEGGRSLITVAVNLGTYTWLMGAVDEVPARATFRGITLDITTSRVGLIQLGDYYSNFYRYDGMQMPVYRSQRKGILAHEGRHSDCSGGVTRKGLEIVRTAVDHEDYMEKFPHGKCGYMHAVCTREGELKGVVACDHKERPWGSYFVSYLYARAAALNIADKSSDEWERMNLEEIHMKARLNYDVDDLLDGKLGDPDLTSRTLID